MTCERKDTCPRPRARRKRANTLWVCPYCSQAWVCRDVGSYAGATWVWEKWPKEKSDNPFEQKPDWLDMGHGH